MHRIDGAKSDDVKIFKPPGNLFKQREHPSNAVWPLNPQIFCVAGISEERAITAARKVNTNLLRQDLKRIPFHKALSSSTAGSGF